MSFLSLTRVCYFSLLEEGERRRGRKLTDICQAAAVKIPIVLLGPAEDRPPVWWCFPLRWCWSRQDICWAEADRAPRHPRRKAGGAVRTQTRQGGRLGTAPEGVTSPHIRGVSGGADFSNFAVFCHRDFGRKACDESTSGYSPGHEHRKDGGTSADPVLAMIPADPYCDCPSGWSWVQHRAHMAIKRREEQMVYEIEANSKANPFLCGVLQLLGESQASFRWHNQTFTSAPRMTPARDRVARHEGFFDYPLPRLL